MGISYLRRARKHSWSHLQVWDIQCIPARKALKLSEGFPALSWPRPGHGICQDPHGTLWCVRGAGPCSTHSSWTRTAPLGCPGVPLYGMRGFSQDQGSWQKQETTPAGCEIRGVILWCEDYFQVIFTICCLWSLSHADVSINNLWSFS